MLVLGLELLIACHYVIPGKVLAASQSSSKYQRWWDDANCIRRGYYKPGECVWHLLLVHILNVLFLSSEVCIPFCLCEWAAAASELKSGSRDENNYGQGWKWKCSQVASCLYMARSCLQEQEDREFLAGPVLWVRYLLTCRERAEDTDPCFKGGLRRVVTFSGKNCFLMAFGLLSLSVLTGALIKFHVFTDKMCGNQGKWE